MENTVYEKLASKEDVELELKRRRRNPLKNITNAPSRVLKRLRRKSFEASSVGAPAKSRRNSFHFGDSSNSDIFENSGNANIRSQQDTNKSTPVSCQVEDYELNSQCSISNRSRRVMMLCCAIIPEEPLP